METKLYAYLSYEIVRGEDGSAGTVLHPEVRKGDAVLMVASNDADYQRPPLIGRSTGQGLYLLVDDVTRFIRRPLLPAPPA